MRAAAASLLLAAPFAGAAIADDDLGRHLAGECASCHVLDGASRGIPTIVGLPPDALLDLVGQYRSGERSHVLMTTMVARYEDDELSVLAAYLEGLGSTD